MAPSACTTRTLQWRYPSPTPRKGRKGRHGSRHPCTAPQSQRTWGTLCTRTPSNGPNKGGHRKNDKRRMVCMHHTYLTMVHPFSAKHNLLVPWWKEKWARKWKKNKQLEGTKTLLQAYFPFGAAKHKQATYEILFDFTIQVFQSNHKRPIPRVTKSQKGRTFHSKRSSPTPLSACKTKVEATLPMWSNPLPENVIKADHLSYSACNRETRWAQ